MYRVTMKIEGMMCGMCEAHINDVIRRNIKDAKKVSSSHKKGESLFICENIPDLKILKEKIKETGYEVRDISCETYEKRGLFK
ncbi:MAG: heavy-metal-associated domain-containing protein [Erysipelotrichaceae bacterium]|nr:heavy-metal-associated domain-containing protein [Erysipelotrichaceae bacterium]